MRYGQGFWDVFIGFCTRLLTVREFGVRYGQGFWDVFMGFCTDNSLSWSPVWGMDKDSGM